MNSAGSSKRPSWKGMIIFTSVLAIGIIIAAFLLAFLWSVDYIDRVKPIAADYGRSPYYAVLPLDPKIIQVARVDHGEIILEGDEVPSATPTPIAEDPTLTNTVVPAQESATSSVSPTDDDPADSTATAVLTLSPTSTLSPTPTNTIFLTPGPSSTPRPTNPRPTHPNPTNTQPAVTATSRPTIIPTSTQAPPTRTRDPYPPPTAYP